MTDAKDAQQPVSQTDVAKKETSKPSKKLKSATVKDVISKTRTMTGSPPDQININPFQESAQHEHTAVMAFGRFNPPTVGHEKLIHKVEQTAKSVGGSAHIIASHSEGDSKNPLPSSAKVGYIKKIADHGTHVYASSKAQPSLLHHAAALHKHAHHLVVVAGQDRVQQFHDLLHKYNGKEGPHGHYNFKSIKVVSAGQRDPDAEGTKGMSGTKMREHAKNGNEAAFRRGLPKALHAHAGEMIKHIQSVTGAEKVKKEEMDAFTSEVHNFIMENTPITNAQHNALDIKSIKSGIELDDLVEAYAYGYHTGLMSESETPEQVGFQSVNSLIANSLFNEDLRQWFKDKWVRMDTKGNIKGDCAREPGEGKPKCLPLAKARAMDKEDRATAARRKRREDPVADRAGKGGKPINVQTEEYIEEKNAPTNPALWARAKSLARSKFDVYPSAYANGWASKWYKSKGGGWKSVSEETINEISDELVGRVNTLRRIGPDIMKGTAPTPHKTSKGAETLQKAVDRVRFRSKVGAPPVKEDVDSIFEDKQHGLYKYNKRSGMWDHQRSVTPETKDQWLHYFKKDEPNEHFVVSKNKPKHNPMKEEVELGEAIKINSKVKIHAPGKDYHGEVGRVGEIRHGLHKTAPKTYTIDYGNRQSIQLDKKNIKLHKEDVDSMFAEKFGKEREAVSRSGQEPKDKDLVMRSGDRKTSDKGYRTQAIVKQVIEAKDKGEYDYEGDMAQSQLRSIMHNSQQIHDMLKPNTNMPEWVQSKITLAADYISTCADYLQSNEEDLDEATTTANLAPYEGPMHKMKKVRNVAIRMANGKIKSLPPGKSGSSGGGGDGGE